MKTRKQAIEPTADSLLQVLPKANTKQASKSHDELLALSKAE